MPGEAIATATAKAAPVFLVAEIAQVVDPWWLLIIVVGLLGGTLVRWGSMLDDKLSPSDIRTQLKVLALSWVANGILAAAVINVAHLNYMPGLAVTLLCAFGGVSTIRLAWREAQRRFAAGAALDRGRAIMGEHVARAPDNKDFADQIERLRGEP